MTNHPRSEFPDETSAILVSVVEIHGQEDILIARQAGRDAARNIGLGTVDQTRLATVISELARNALRYAGGGQCRITTQVAAPDPHHRAGNRGSGTRHRQRDRRPHTGLLDRRRTRSRHVRRPQADGRHGRGDAAGTNHDPGSDGAAYMTTPIGSERPDEAPLETLMFRIIAEIDVAEARRAARHIAGRHGFQDGAGLWLRHGGVRDRDQSRPPMPTVAASSI